MRRLTPPEQVQLIEEIGSLLTSNFVSTLRYGNDLNDRTRETLHRTFKRDAEAIVTFIEYSKSECSRWRALDRVHNSPVESPLHHDNRCLLHRVLGD